MTRVLFVTTRYPPAIAGGGEVSLQLLAQSLAARGHVVCVASADEGAAWVNGISVARLAPLADPARLEGAFSSICALAKEADLIHAYNLEFRGRRLGLFDLLADRKAKVGVPVLAQLNHPSVYFKSVAVKNPLKRLLRAREERLCLRRLRAFDAFIALSEQLKAHYVGLGLPAARILVVPNMLPDDYFFPPQPLPAGPVVLFIGNLGAHKGAADLLEAFVAARAQHQGAKLRLIGWGSEEEKSALAALIAKHELAQSASIELPVPHEAVRAAYDAASILVHPGRWQEPFGRDVIEAMARGRPVLVSDAGEPPNIVEDRELVFAPKDVRELARKLDWLLGDPRAAARIGKAMRERSHRYSIAMVLPQIEKAYEALLRQTL